MKLVKLQDIIDEMDEFHKYLNTETGRGAFRRFKDAIYRCRLEDFWYKFRYEALKSLAIKWCQNHNIPYEETR